MLPAVGNPLLESYSYDLQDSALNASVRNQAHLFTYFV